MGGLVFVAARSTTGVGDAIALALIPASSRDKVAAFIGTPFKRPASHGRSFLGIAAVAKNCAGHMAAGRISTRTAAGLDGFAGMSAVGKARGARLKDLGMRLKRGTEPHRFSNYSCGNLLRARGRGNP